jgi:ferric enterobactin receptor
MGDLIIERKTKGIERIGKIVTLCGLLFVSATVFSQNNPLDIKVTRQYYGTADKLLTELAETYKLKLNFNNERLSRYEMSENFQNMRLEDVIIRICRVTKSKYFISTDGTTYIIPRGDEKEIPDEVIEDKQQTGRTVIEVPKRFGILVSGRVKDAGSGEPLPNVNVSVPGTTRGTSTNVDGYFTLHNVPSDTSILAFTIVGYSLHKHYLSPSQPLTNIVVNIYSTSSLLSGVVVTGQKKETFKLNQKVGMIRLTPAKIITLPAIGEKDIFRAFQLMPGISAGNEQSSGLYVRGGTPDQNLVLFDGFTVYNVDHLFGFFSAFNTNAIKDVQLYKGGFEPKYGGRLSALVDITGKEGNKKLFNGGVDLGLLSAGVFAESPLGSKSSFLIAYRRSFQTSLYDKLKDKLSNSGDSDSPSGGLPQRGPGGAGGAPPNGASKLASYFDDLNAKLTFNPTKKDVISWCFYTGKDKLDNSISLPGGVPPGGSSTISNAGSTDITKWGNTGTSFKWSHTWNPKFFSYTLFSYSNYFSDRNNTRQADITDSSGNTEKFRNGTIESNNLKDFSYKSDFEWKPNQTHAVGFGWQLTHNDILYQYSQNDTTYIIDRHTNGNIYAAYIQDELSLFADKLVLIPGIRTSWFSPTGKMYYEPRINITYAVTDKIKLKGSAGQYYQFAKHVVREDILKGSRDFWVLADKNKLPVASSNQFIVGASWENDDYLIDVEVYYKQMKGLTEYTLRFQPVRASPTIDYQEFFYQGTGYSRGVDILLQKKFGKYNGWAGYTFGLVKNNFPVYDNNDFFANNDVRHEFKMVHTYKWKRLDFSLVWFYLTGKPYTAPDGGYELTLVDGATQNYMTVSEKNAHRLPGYQRLDAAITLNYGRSGKTNGTIGLSFFNLLNHKNIWYKDYQILSNTIYETDVNYLGFTPNLSFSIKLK